MTTTQRGQVTGTGPKGIQCSEDVARLIELRMNGMTLTAAAEACGIPFTTAREWIKKYIRHVSSSAVRAFRDQELATLERAQAQVLKMAEMPNYKFDRGSLVTVPHPTLVDDKGLPVMVPVLDTDPNVRAFVTLVKIMERKSRLIGGDKPLPKNEDPVSPAEDGDKPSTGVMTPAMMEAALKRLESKINIGIRGPIDVQDAVVHTIDPLVDEANE